MWPTKPTTSGRRVRRSRGAFRFDPKFTNQTVKYPDQILIWGGISEGLLISATHGDHELREVRLDPQEEGGEGDEGEATLLTSCQWEV